VNGVQRTGDGNRFTINDVNSVYELEIQAGVTGEFDPITIRSAAGRFDIQGGNGAGRAVGTDAVAVINGVRRVGSRNGFTVHGREGSYLIRFSDDFSGDFDAITVTHDSDILKVRGGELGSLLRGRDASVTVSEEQLQISRSTRTVSDAADFAIARSASRQLYRLAQRDPGALRAILIPKRVLRSPSAS
jgi:hypothetical protein